MTGEVTAGGSISIYSDVIITGNAKITSQKCIDVYNGTIYIDISERDKTEAEVLSYNCENTPDIDVELTGNRTDGCLPRYEIQQRSLILIFDTKSCQTSKYDDIILWVILSSIGIGIIIIAIILIVVFQHEGIKRRVFENRTKTTTNMDEIQRKMQYIDDDIDKVNATVDRLNTMLDE